MINLDLLNEHRLRDEYVLRRFGSYGNHKAGAFLVPYPLTGGHLRCLASNGGGWDHVSVSTEGRTPLWAEMDYIKRAFFEPHEVVMQLHPAEKDHISHHDFVLHLWRPHHKEIPLPPKLMV